MPQIFYSLAFRRHLLQFSVLGIVAALFWFLISNAITNLSEQRIASGFDFLFTEAAFDIGESFIEYSSTSSFLKAFQVGLLNTLLVALIGNIFAVFLGTFIGMARVSSNWLIKKVSDVYIETFRNIPLLLQLFFWYVLISEFLPSVREAEPYLGSVFLTQRGLYFPFPQNILEPTAIALFALISLVMIYRKWRKSNRFDFKPLLLPVVLGAFVLIFGRPLEFTSPMLAGFNFEGGASITPELGALLLGLVLYTAAFIAEIVRSGIESIDRGQVEAGMSLGLKPPLVFQFIVLPQAMRVVVPPLTSQLLNLTKNSSLAVAIGYPDLLNVSNTALNQTGQAVECILIVMLIYLSFSLLTSLVMNIYNKKTAIPGEAR